ncbi:hypothetical protein A2U01_0066624, partial [Trifolium medium]|nr:hypothetical protein [Trifolium medium]
ATLEAIYQGKDESLRNFIERFYKEAIQVETTDYMKKYLLERGLRPHSDFAKAVGIEKPRTLDELLLKRTTTLLGNRIARVAVKGRTTNTGSPGDRLACSRTTLPSLLRA